MDPPPLVPKTSDQAAGTHQSANAYQAEIVDQSKKHADHFPPAKKLTRISRACDFCHKRSIKCKACKEDNTRCQNCVDFALPCEYQRPVLKRGGKKKQSSRSKRSGSSPGDGDNDTPWSLPEKWRSMASTHDQIIQDLVEVYFEVVYPIFPFFHGPSMRARITNQEYLTNRSFFAATMGVCALASARARDGALFPGRWEAGHFTRLEPRSFFLAAMQAIPSHLGDMHGIDWMCTCGVLALYGIQVGKIEVMEQYLGLYHSIVSMDSLHDERNWPKASISIIEVEMRRRLFWSMYTLEVYSSIIWSSLIRSRESISYVSYPSEIIDESISEAGYQLPNSLGPSFPSEPIKDTSCWLHGWNFITDLYRVLEHAMGNLQYRTLQHAAMFSPADLFFGATTNNYSVVLSKVLELHACLPARFKDLNLSELSISTPDENRFPFQAANITGTVQLVRMVLLTGTKATADEKCTIAMDLVEQFSQIPSLLLRAISSPLAHQLAGIGAMLGSVIESPLSLEAYMRVREVLLALAILLDRLEYGITRVVGGATRLRDLIERMDTYMKPQFPNGVFTPVEDPPLVRSRSTSSGSGKADSGLPVMTSTSPALYQEPGPLDILASGSIMSGLNGNIADQSQFPLQFPPELLDGWQLRTDMAAFGFFPNQVQ